ncbi:MAG: metallopeptidase family protein [Candidatus Saccharimonadales bacterium]
MISVSNEEFNQFASEAVDSLPSQYLDHLNNVAIVVEDEPTPEQRQKLHLVNGVTLFGLYEGIPLTNRSGNYSLVLPDKITIFKLPIEASCNSLDELKEQIKRTLWHEIAHHYGLGHDRIHELEQGTSR